MTRFWIFPAPPESSAIFSRIHMLTNLVLLSGFTGASYVVLGLLSYKGIREERAARGE